MEQLLGAVFGNREATDDFVSVFAGEYVHYSRHMSRIADTWLLALKPVDVSRPIGDIVPGPRGMLLAALVQLETPVTVRALARHAGISPQGALRLVNELSHSGLVLTQPAGRALLVSLNRDHLAAEPLLALASLRGRLVQRLTAELEGWPQLAGAWLFGSMARGDGGPDSDIDLLLVAEATVDDEDWVERTAALTGQVRSWTGNRVHLVEQTRSSFVRLVKRRNPLVTSLRADGIPLTRRSRELLRRAA
jgi:predicted nucleotidyltransferase